MKRWQLPFVMLVACLVTLPGWVLARTAQAADADSTGTATRKEAGGSGLPAPDGPQAAQEAMRRWMQAVGGESNLRRIRDVQIRGDKTESGIEGTAEEWLHEGNYREVTYQKDDRSELVCKGTSCWVRDWNGKVEALQGRDRSDLISVSHIAALLYGGALSGVAGAELVPGETDAQDKNLTIRFTPEEGIPFEVWVDLTTGLPSRIVRRPYDDAITLELADWRQVDGISFPFSVRETSGDNKSSQTVVREIVLNGGVSPTIFERPEGGKPDFHFGTGHVALGIPFNFENDHIMIDCRVNGSAPIWFLLDTGADATILNKTRVQEYGLETFGSTSVTGGGNSTDFAYAKVAQLTIGNVEFDGQRVGVLDLTGLEKIYGRPLGGLLGYDFLSRLVVSIDYEHKTIDLYDPAAFVYEGEGKRLPFILESGQPRIAAAIAVPTAPDIAANFIVDVGAADNVNLTAPFVKANRLTELARKTPAPAPNTMPGSEKEFFAQTSVRGKLTSLDLGEYVLHDVPANLMLSTKGAYSSASFSGTIGQGVLHRFNTIYDYAHRVMILAPNAEFDKPFPPRKTFGATFLSDGPDLRVFKVTGIRKDSPAEAAGLKTGDVVVAVDGKPAAQMRLVELRRMLQAEGSKHSLAIQRGDTPPLKLDVTVQLVSLDEE